MSARHLITATAEPLAAGVTEFSAGRLGATVGGLLGLAAVAVAVLLLRRPGTGNAQLWATAARVAGVVAMLLGGLVAATAEGGLGTGNGLGGAYVALLLGLTGTVLGGRALSRDRTGR
ncbi:DUF6223 family protein [Streptomyces sp. TBY4]|uniref:DUF6223 family protein n=1 Tax=Streptomyces sp. TBY4 TaxID=2962030 RepID=UPI0020B7239B|nr:DUF6223 family protein [Streptomyces sp. TBY4]MCP3755292.1 DUF6223 family protein [Streptomyces sp. TBY4]